MGIESRTSARSARTESRKSIEVSSGNRDITIKIAVVDRSPMMAEAIKDFLSGSAARKRELHCDVTAKTSCADIPNEADFDLVILHIPECPDVGATIEEWRQALPDRVQTVPVVLYAETWRPEDLHTAIEIGVRGYLPATLECASFLDTLRVLAAGMSVYPPIPCRQSSTDPATGPVPSEQAVAALSERERQVLAGLHEGCSNKVIANDLGLSLSTVKVHMRSIFRKLGVRNRTEAAMMARSVLPALSEDLD